MSRRFYEFGAYQIDASRRLLLNEGQAVPLTPKSFDILLALVEGAGETISKHELMQRVWPDSFVEDGNLTYNISVLRKALGERASDRQFIVTVPGRGYRFVAAVRETPPASPHEVMCRASQAATTCQEAVPLSRASAWRWSWMRALLRRIRNGKAQIK
jgi:DNA-binding winged helix-turn-helix (wHTH) protein